ncbi:autotransporter domain-containing protein, partial [Gallibacterium sp. AGMB14963]|uniref:autotransporter domain-containing protein n=1 Tax=Gallibacterium faecale TaxID=3019086 RepID=UPI0022F1CAE4
NVEGEATANLQINVGQTSTINSVVINTDGKTTNEGTLNVGGGSGSITVNGGTLASSGTTTAGTLTVNQGVKEGGAVRSGEVNVTGGTTTATTTDIQDGTVTVSDGAKLSGGEIKVGNGDGTAASDSAGLVVNGEVEATSVTVKNDGTVDVGTTGKLGTETSAIPTVNVDGGTLNSSGTTNATTLTADNGGKVNVNGGTTTATTLNVNNDGAVKVNAGTADITTTNIKDGAVTVAAGATLDSDTLNVGDGSDSSGTATLTNAGTVNADNVTVKSDGQLDNNGTLGDADTAITVDGGTLNSTGTTNAASLAVDNDGTVNVNGGTTDVGTTNINDGTVSVGANGTLDSDTLNVGDGTDGAGTAALTNEGTVNADNVTVKSDGQLDNNGTLGDTETNIAVEGGTLNSTGTTNANTLTVDNDGKVNVNDGTTDVGTTNINDGTVSVGANGTLDSDTLNVGDGTDGAGTAALTNAGTVASDIINVNKDGNLTNTGELTADTALNVDGGTVALDDGTITTPETNIKAGTVNVGTDGTLDAGKLTVGDGNGDPSTASLNADGTVKATDLVANKDGNIAVNNGATVTATTSAKVAGGIIAINQGGILNSGEHGENDFVVDSGSVNVDGTLNAKNITSDPAQDSSADDAKINVGSTGTLNLKPTGDQPLFAGLDTSKGDAINVDGKLNVDVADGNTATQANTAGITGTGTLNKEGNGGLVLTAPTNTLGTVNANDGVLTVDNGSKLNANTLNVGDSDDKPATVNVNGEAAAADVNIAKDGTLNVGDASGTPAGKLAATNPISMNGGTLNVNPNATLTTPNIVSPDTADNETSTVNVANDATLNLNPTDGAKLFDGFNSAPGGKDAINLDGTLNLNVASGTVTQPVSAPISGNGTFNKEGSGTFDVKANNPFTGAVNVNDGTLQISEGGKLGNATVNVNSPATLAVDKNGTELGNLNLNGGGTLSVAATPAGYAKIQVNGDANLNNGHLFTDIAGSHEEDLENGNFANVISTPNGQIIGDFASYDDNSHLFNFVPYITDDHKAVGLTPYSVGGDHSLESISNKLGFGRAADAGRALDTIFKANPANELSRLFYTIRDDKQAANAVLESLPTLAGASSQVVADTSRHLANLAKIYDRCEDNVQQGDKHIWAKTFGSWGTQDQYQGAAGYRSESYGFAAGVEKCHQQTRLGVMMGYAYDHVRSRESVSDQRLRADTIQAGIYGNTPISSIADLDFRAGIGYSDVGTERNIKFANRTAQGNYGNKIGYAGVGVNFNAFSSEQAVIKPFIRLDYQVVRNNHYTERGAGVLNLNVDAGTNQSLVSQVGVDMKAHLADKLSVNTRVSVGYDLVGEPASVRAAFAGAPDIKFTTQGAQHGRVSGELGIEMNYHITPAATLSVGYDASARKGYIEHTPNIMF